MAQAPEIGAAKGPPHRALTIAKWFIAWAEAEEDELSNLKLQKLLYYAQGHRLAEQHKPLFADPIQAWSHGPVIPAVYHKYKEHGRDSIELPDDDSFNWEDVDRETSDLLIRVWNTYGGFSAGRLRNMTHTERPWKSHFRPDEHDIVIPAGEIEESFTERQRRA
jgi:uncharacterized phage-associated protein